MAVAPLIYGIIYRKYKYPKCAGPFSDMGRDRGKDETKVIYVAKKRFSKRAAIL